MRSGNEYIVTKREVQAEAEWWLEKSLKLRCAGHKCTTSVLLKLILLAAAKLLSIGAACQFLADAPSAQAVYDALHGNLPSLKELQRRLNLALVTRLPKPLRRKPRCVAIDLTLIPYHGQPFAHVNELYRGQPKSGTTKFHAYATAFVVHHGFRWTLGLIRVPQGMRMCEVVKELIHIVRRREIRIQCVLLDRGFYSTDVMAYLRQARYPFLMPVSIRGRKSKTGKPTGMRRLLKARPGFYKQTIHGRVGRTKNKALHLTVCVAWKVYKHARTGKKHRKALLYTSWRVPGGPREILEMYRRRFGIEASYRQMNQARIRTSTRSPVERLLYVAVALILRNVWAWLHFLLARGKRGSSPDLHLELLRFKQMLSWIAQVTDSLLGADRVEGLDYETYIRLTTPA